MTHTSAELAALLWIGAQGYRPDEAAVALLTCHDVWLRRSDFVRACVTVETDLMGEESAAFVDWAGAVRALDAGELPCSSSEASVLRIAAGIGGIPVDLRAMLGGLDARNIQLVAEAVMHANGTPTTALQALSRPSTEPGEGRRHG
jgi:hypothetical protein